MSLIKKGIYTGEKHVRFGKHLPDTAKQRIGTASRIRNSGNNNPSAVKVKYEGIVYGSYKELSNKIGVRPDTISNWIKQHKYTDKLQLV